MSVGIALLITQVEQVTTDTRYRRRDEVSSLLGLEYRIDRNSLERVCLNPPPRSIAQGREQRRQILRVSCVAKKSTEKKRTRGDL